MAKLSLLIAAAAVASTAAAPAAAPDMTKAEAIARLQGIVDATAAKSPARCPTNLDLFDFLSLVGCVTKGDSVYGALECFSPSFCPDDAGELPNLTKKFGDCEENLQTLFAEVADSLVPNGCAVEFDNNIAEGASVLCFVPVRSLVESLCAADTVLGKNTTSSTIQDTLSADVLACTAFDAVVIGTTEASAVKGAVDALWDCDSVASEVAATKALLAPSSTEAPSSQGSLPGGGNSTGDGNIAVRTGGASAAALASAVVALAAWF